MLITKVPRAGLDKIKEKFNKKYRYISSVLRFFKIKCRCTNLSYYSFDRMIIEGIKRQKLAGSVSIKINKCPICKRYYLTKVIDKTAERIFGV